jgi:signal transduction histidine kinase
MSPLTTTHSQEVIGDQSELERLRAELYAAQQREAYTNQMIAEQQTAFVASLTHDLKNPLTTIMGRIEMLKRLTQRSEITAADIERHLLPLDGAVNRLQQLLQSASQRDGHSLAIKEQADGR